MIERYFSQAKVLIRLRSGPVGPYLPRFVRALEQRRFSFVAIFVERTVCAAGSTVKVVAVVEANQSHIERYSSCARDGSNIGGGSANIYYTFIFCSV